MSSLRAALQALAAFGLAAPVLAAPAADATGTITTRVRVVRPEGTSAGAMKALKRRLASAAMEACGGSDFSVAPMKAAVLRSRCWQDAFADAIERIDRGGVRSADASLMRGRP